MINIANGEQNMDEINATKKKRERHFKSRYKNIALTNIFKTVIMDRK
jgi:hypothetical protein